MIDMASGTEITLTLGISLVTLAWLSICAIFDARTHMVPNWLTLSAISIAIGLCWFARESRDERIYESLFHLVILVVSLLLAWRIHLVGGADLKILVVLALVGTQYFLAAWIGALMYFFTLSVLLHNRPKHFAGVPGFALGIGLLTISQILVLYPLHLSA
jgi:Flp pilus assembly protein protease CpaA